MLSVWFDPGTVWQAGKTGKRGRPEAFSDAAVQVCLTLKVLFGLPLRQTVGPVESLIRMAGLDWPVPDYSTPCRRQARLGVQIPCRRPGRPSNLLVDSTGVKFRGDGDWPARKHGPSRRRQWRKVHIIMDTETGDMRAVEFPSSRQGGSPLTPDLLVQIPEDEEVATVTTDGADDTRRCHGAIISRGAEAIIPIRRNGRAWKEDCPAASVRNEILHAMRHLGRALWKTWAGSHGRTRGEARMNRFKLLGKRIMSRDPNRQTAEIQIRILRRFIRTGGIHRLSHEPLLSPRHGRDRGHRLNDYQTGELQPQC